MQDQQAAPKAASELTPAQQAILDELSKAMTHVGIGPDGRVNRVAMRALSAQAAAKLTMKGLNRFAAKRLCEASQTMAPRYPSSHV